MTNVAAGVLGLVVLVAPVLGLLGWASWRDRRREAVIARQIRLTDAIAAEMGAVVAPVMSKPLGGAWRVALKVPAGRPALVARLVAIVQETLGRIDGSGYELVLTTDPAAWPGAASPTRRLRAA